jgi:threonine/homoserine/homoserine lactone efflux protein
MELATIINFFIILFIFAIIPGPATFAVLSTSTRYSLIASILLAAGVTVGDLVYTSAVLFSFSLFEEILTPIFVYIRIVGAIYIAYLGLSLILKKPTKFKDQKLRKIYGFNLVLVFFFVFQIQNQWYFIF